MQNMAKSKQRGIFYGVLILGLVTLASTGCLKTGGINSNNTNAVTYLTVMNLAPYAPSTEIYLNGTKATGPVAPGSYSSSYAHLIPATYDVQFKKSGSDSLLAEIPSSSYDSLGFYTLILYNDSVQGSAKAVKIHDDYSSVTMGSTYYRFINMCPSLPYVD